MLNYAVISGIVKRRKTLALTPKGLAVLHILVENTVYSLYDLTKITVSEIEVIIWGSLAQKMDEKLHEGTPVVVEGTLTHRKKRDSAGGEHHKTVLKAGHIQILSRSHERKT